MSLDPPEPERGVELSVAVEVVLDGHDVLEHDAGELVAVRVRVERERQRALLRDRAGLLELARVVTDYFDKAGNITRAEIHQVEQDTFSANGKTLTGIPFTFALAFRLDENGDPVSVVATGVAEKVPLPDGSLFVSAGWLDFVDHPGANFVLSPDRGNPGNVAGFCAALAP